MNSATDDREQRMAVMLVDDDKFLVDLYAMKFTNAGFQVYACHSTPRALQALRDGEGASSTEG